MRDDFLNLFDFGTNDNGEYVNLMEEEKRLKDISEEVFYKWLEEHENPLIRIAFDNYISAIDIDNGIFNEIKEELERIVLTKCYHYGNMAKDMYIFSINDNGRHMIVFENPKHYLVFEPQIYKTDKHGNLIDIKFEDYLLGDEEIYFPALFCPCYDLKGNRIKEYCDSPYQNDIRHKVVIDEWQMDKFGENRMDEGKKIKQFYEVMFTLPQLINYWGEEKEIENGTIY